jgi:hypothetical protein
LVLGIVRRCGDQGRIRLCEVLVEGAGELVWPVELSASDAEALSQFDKVGIVEGER